MHVARVLEELRRAPQHALAALALQGLCQGHHGVQVGVALLKGGALGCDVPAQRGKGEYGGVRWGGVGWVWGG